MNLPALSRRSAPGVLALLLTACGDSDAGPSATPTDPESFQFLTHACRGSDGTSTDPNATEKPRALRDFGHRVGVAISGARLSEVDYAATAAEHFNYVTAENEMKWDTIEPSPGQFNFPPADAIVRFAEENEMLVKGHTLVWHSQLPGWVNALRGADAVREAMTRHIETVVAHYRDDFPGTVVLWDVVNEAIDTPMGIPGYRQSIFYRELGEGYVAEAFQIARAADPDALLFYNDFGIEGLSPKANAAYEMIRGLVEAGVPIDGVGLQMHTQADNRGPTYDELRANIQRYEALGLKVNISEMDVNLCPLGDGAFSLEAQRFRYNRAFRICLEFEACESVALWGVTDKYSWLNASEICANAAYAAAPLAFDGDYAKKPAFWGIYDALDGCYYE